jgi:N-acylneuraminate cytidylyltransferase
MKKKIFLFIFAKKNSTRLKNKNVRLFNRVPLINYTLKFAKKLSFIDEIFVSTDSKQIKKIVKKFDGVNIIDRPKYLCSKNSDEFLSWKHAVKYVIKKFGAFDTFISLPTTSPLRKVNDIKKCLKKFKKNNKSIVLTYTKSNTMPWMNMVKVENSKLKLLAKKKSLREVFNLCTVCYVTNPLFILNNNSLFDKNVLGVEIPKERSIDIDTIFDFKFAEFLNTKNKYAFK